MLKRGIRTGMLVVVTALALCSWAGAKEISKAELLKTATQVGALTAKAVDIRNKMEKADPAKFIKDIDALRKQFDSIMVLIATTTPAANAQQFAVHLAIGTKDVELALWYYLAGILEKNKDEMAIGDNLLKEGLAQLKTAETLSKK